MPELISTLTTRLQYAYPDASQTMCEAALNVAHRAFVEVCPEAARTSEDILQVGNQARYELNASNVEVHSVLYLTAAAAGSYLTAIDRDQLRAEMEGTSGTPYPLATGTPAKYCVDSLLSGNDSDIGIIVFPTPTTSAVGGYPLFRVYYTSVTTLGTSDYTPEGLASTDFYYQRALQELSEWLRPERLSEFKAKADEALPKAVAQYRSVAREKPLG